jgi:hypothetical protein
MNSRQSDQRFTIRVSPKIAEQIISFAHDVEEEPVSESIRRLLEIGLKKTSAPDFSSELESYFDKLHTQLEAQIMAIVERQTAMNERQKVLEMKIDELMNKPNKVLEQLLTSLFDKNFLFFRGLFDVLEKHDKQSVVMQETIEKVHANILGFGQSMVKNFQTLADVFKKTR